MEFFTFFLAVNFVIATGDIAKIHILTSIRENRERKNKERRKNTAKTV